MHAVVVAACAGDGHVGERERLGAAVVGDGAALDVAAGDVAGVAAGDFHTAHVDFILGGGLHTKRRCSQRG